MKCGDGFRVAVKLDGNGMGKYIKDFRKKHNWPALYAPPPLLIDIKQRFAF